ncbi:MAG: hypothetical protein E7557_03305 [Ruminococcaceae bacterium]|nr:hypothetical protein [Oscillospiraceae bacterium]
MKLTPAMKIILAVAAICIAVTLITTNNIATVMVLYGINTTPAATVQGNNTQGTVNSNTQNNGGYVDNSASVNTNTNTNTNTSTDTNAGTSTDSNTATTPSGNTSTNNNSGTANNNADAQKPADKNTNSNSLVGTNKAVIVDYFNKASNKAKTSAKSITKDREENYQAQPINLGALGMFQGIVNNLIDSNMGVNEEQSGRTGTTAADKNAIYPVENESWASKLTAEDVAKAECTEKDGVYTITLELVNDPLANEYAHGSGHHGKAFNIVMPQTIKDNAGGAASLLSSLKVGYENGKIIVTVDAATGNITSAKYDFVWLLNIDMFGGITAYFGIRTDYTIKW